MVVWVLCILMSIFTQKQNSNRIRLFPCENIIHYASCWRCQRRVSVVWNMYQRIRWRNPHPASSSMSSYILSFMYEENLERKPDGLSILQSRVCFAKRWDLRLSKRFHQTEFDRVPKGAKEIFRHSLQRLSWRQHRSRFL